MHVCMYLSPVLLWMQKYYGELFATGIGAGVQVRRVNGEMGKGS